MPDVKDKRRRNPEAKSIAIPPTAKSGVLKEAGARASMQIFGRTILKPRKPKKK